MNPNLQKAIDVLQIRDVYFSKSNAFVREDFVRDPCEDVECPIQSKHNVRGFKLLKAEGDDGEELLYRVTIDLGVRALSPGSKRESVKPSDVVAQIECVMVAEYVATKNPGQSALDEFARHNASYHVWPFWREFVFDACTRMNIPKIAVPIHQFARNRDEKSTITHSEDGRSRKAKARKAIHSETSTE